jgi:hypothetical protein
MKASLARLSIEEIRDRYARAREPVTPQALNKLKRDPRQGVRQIYEALKKRYEREFSERTRLDAMLNFERVLWRAGVQHIAGVDEVGMGPRSCRASTIRSASTSSSAWKRSGGFAARPSRSASVEPRSTRSTA